MNYATAFIVFCLAMLAAGCATRSAPAALPQSVTPAQEPVLAIAPMQEAVMNEPEVLEVIEVEILGPIWPGWPRGRDWVTKEEDQPRSRIFLTDTHELVIRLPGGRVIRHYSSRTFFTQYRGHIVRVSLTPHDGTMPYQDTIQMLESILDEWNAELREQFVPDMERWKARGELSLRGHALPMPADQGGATLRDEERAGISFRIQSVLPGRHGLEHPGGWMLFIDVAVRRDEVRKMLEGPDTHEPIVH